MRKIKWGVLGTAGIAKGCTIPGMQQAENCELYAIAGRDPQKLADFQKEFGFNRVYEGYDALLRDEAVEAVYIPLPNELHYEWTMKALKAGKHVLCEKPLAPTVAQIEEMIACAKENGVVLMEAFAYLHSPFIAAVKKELDSGIIGDVLYMESAFLTSDYDLSNIRMRKATFGGCTYDLGCYCTSQILWMLDREPVSVKAVADFSEEGVDVLTSAQVLFEGGVRASFLSGMCLATEKNHRIDRFCIFGTEGSISSDVRFNQEGELTYRITKNGTVTEKTVKTPHNYRLEVEQLGRCITDGEEPHVSHAFTVRNARLMEAVLKKIGY
ncbi:MAG: Gfo/Idh/MocA family oxidoreductase [Oscillospiraceae bacterium]|nr:Gfo/Idh/MocA family oxidoreductase [Oscillospiraceae bacterium]